MTSLIEGDDLISKLKEQREVNDSIIEGKDKQISDLSMVVIQLTKKLEEFESARPRPEGSPEVGII